MATYDVAFSFSAGLRPGSITDANDKTQLAELKAQDEFTMHA